MSLNNPIHIISLGAGVQSSTMALMAAHGEILPMPNCAIFADTKAEPLEVYRWLDWLEKQLPFPVVRCVEKRGLLSALAKSIAGKRIASLPFFTESPEGGGKLKRQCTLEFKITPIHNAIRKAIGLKPGERAGKSVRVIQWIGISIDEVSRMKESRVKWMEHRWPIVDLGMKRYDCLRWMEKHGYPTPPVQPAHFARFTRMRSGGV